ncbi:MAG: carboxypeptidase-like regulatory domain-containing protein [Gallionellaceae bacterium]
MTSQYNHIVILFFALLFSANSHAAEWTVKGQVLEKGTRKPLSGAYIVVRENEALTANSDDKGHFELTLPSDGRYTLTAASLGGASPISVPIELKAGTPAPSPIFYLPSATLLEEIVVRADRSPDRISKSVMTGTELRRVAGSSGDPLKSLQSLPGVASTNSSAPAVRGSGPQDNLYYVDSLPVGKIFHVGGISVFNADLIQDFNLYSAAFAPRFGDVTGAIIDVALRDPRTDRLGGKLNINLLGADFLVEGPTAENQSAYFAVRRSYFDLFIKQVEQKGITLQIPVYSDYQGKYIWKLNETDRLTFHLLGAADALKLNIGSNSDTAKQQPILSGDLSFSDSYAMQAAVWDAKLAHSQNKFAIEHITSDFSGLFAAAGNIAINQDISQLREFARIPFAENHELGLGANVSQSKTSINADFIKTTCSQFNPSCDLSSATREQLVDSFNNNAWEVSAQDRAKIAPTLTLIGGVHHSYEDYLGKSYTEPRIGAEWEWNERTLLTAGWGKHNQMPTGQQLSKKFGNPNLDHLLAEHSVVGVTKKLDNDWTWKAETYYKKFSNLVLGDTTLNYINGGSGNAYGAELLVKKDGLSDLTGWLAVSLARSQRQNDITGQSFRFQYDQPINTTLVTNYKLNDDWSLGGKWNYHSGTPYTPVIGTTQDSNGRYIPTYAAVNSGTLPDYHRLDIRFDRTYVYNTWKLNVYYELNNVYFRKNLSGYRYDPTYTQKEEVYPLVIPFTFGVQGEF